MAARSLAQKAVKPDKLLAQVLIFVPSVVKSKVVIYVASQTKLYAQVVAFSKVRQDAAKFPKMLKQSLSVQNVGKLSVLSCAVS